MAEKKAANKGPGYVLWFKPFAQKTIEQVMFHPKGRGILKWILQPDKFVDKPTLKNAVREILRRGEDREVVAMCQCGKHKAKYISVSGSPEYGYSMGPSYLFCDKCKDQIVKENAVLLPIAFSSIDSFPNQTDRKQFLELLKFCLFGSKKTISRIVAHKLFFPEQY